MKYIVYKTTCLVNSKIYIGYHRTSNPEVFDGYLGCGLYKQHNESAAQAKRVLGLKLASISQAIRLNRQCNGFRWTRTDNPTETIDISH